ncbi:MULTISPECIES: hypothetical protein [Lactococcus]|uniref:hypothetical protein n=1 Tax=Lactococcus TaxID=1357 RepID=UPI0009BDC126|nr:hypothetical protein [Lactococcus cremoris]
MTIKNKKELSSSIEQLEKAINHQETILKKFDNEQLDFEQIKKLENLLIQEREKAKQVQIKINRSVLQNNSENYKERKKRTRQLIQKGALLEKYLEAKHLTVDETEQLLQTFANMINKQKPDKYKKKV